MDDKDRDLQKALKRLEHERIEQDHEEAPLAPINSEFHPLTEKEKKEFTSFRPLENEECGLTRVLSELDSKEDITSSRQTASGNEIVLDPVLGHIPNSQHSKNYPMWPRAVITLALGFTAAWAIFIGYVLFRFIFMVGQ